MVPDSFDQWEALVKEISGVRSLEELPIVMTPSNGFHVYFRCEERVQGNQKLARRKGLEGRPEVLIETRGEGGYTILPESPPECHPSKQPYFLVQGDLTKIPTVSGKERTLLLESSRALNEYADPKRIISGPSNPRGDRPGDDFNARTDWLEILQPHGWQKAGHRAEITYWRRPGKNRGISATTNFGGTDLFYNFSSNGHPFEANTAYSKFAAHTSLNHKGDFTAAAADLRDKGYGNTGDWPDCSDLPPFLPEAPPLDPDLLPQPLREWIIDEAERMQVPIEMVAIPVLVGLSSVGGRQIGVHPKKHDDWLVIPNLWGGVVARSGMLKSPAQEKALAPIETLVKKATQEYENGLAESSAKQEVYAVKIKVVKKRIEEAFKKDETPTTPQKDLADLKRKKAASKPTERRYKTNDPTVEKLGELMKENPNGMLLIRDELSGWLRSLEKDGREGDREFYLESWSGQSSFTVDRIGRGKIHIPALCTSIIGGIQPGKLGKYLSEALQYGWGDDGLLQRFQLIVYPEIPEDWENVDRKPDREARKKALDVFRRLDQLKLVNVSGKVPALHFDSDAQDFFNSRLEQLEKRLRSGEIGCAALESHLAKYRSLMPALALLFHLAEMPVEASVDGSAIGLDVARRAADFCDFLEKHALKAYAGAIRPDLQSAHALAEKLKNGKVEDGTTVRDIYRNQWSFLTSPVLVRAALDILEECGWVKTQIAETGGRSTEIVELNPELKK
jgi:putative DNA primase/helicase